MVWYNDELAYIEFQSTPSLRRATQSTLQEAEATPISIHALLAEGDDARLVFEDMEDGFQSTPSLRRATKRTTIYTIHSHNFNPRPPCGGRRDVVDGSVCPFEDFNPRPPCGGRRLEVVGVQSAGVISIHALLAEGDIAVSVGAITI